MYSLPSVSLKSINSLPTMFFLLSVGAAFCGHVIDNHIQIPVDELALGLLISSKAFSLPLALMYSIAFSPLPRLRPWCLHLLHRHNPPNNRIDKNAATPAIINILFITYPSPFNCLPIHGFLPAEVPASWMVISLLFSPVASWATLCQLSISDAFLRL